MIINSINPINEFEFKLEDLKSRSKNFLLANSEKPNDELIYALILKNLSDSQISIDAEGMMLDHDDLFNCDHVDSNKQKECDAEKCDYDE